MTTGNRELKFRVWNIEDKRWDNPAILEVFTSEGVLEPFQYIKSGKLNPLYIPIENYVIQQYTGNKDKNGKEIYEGDVIKEKHYGDWGDTDNYDYIGVVYWSSLGCGFRTLPKPDISCNGNIFTENNTIEVIGNIFENPELLK